MLPLTDLLLLLAALVAAGLVGGLIAGLFTWNWTIDATPGFLMKSASVGRGGPSRSGVNWHSTS